MRHFSSYARPVVVAALFLLAVVQSAWPARARAAGAAEAVERGRFRIYKLLYPVGWESYEVVRDGRSLLMRAKFEINYLGDAVSLDATLRTGLDFSPTRFEIKGRTSTRSEIDTTVEIREGEANVREGRQTRTVNAGGRAFPTGGLLPVSFQAPLFRYAKLRGARLWLATLPGGRVHFERRGSDRIRAGGPEVTLERYSVSGLMWGRETVWFDRSGRLVAVVSPDAELDRLEAVREGYEAALPLFVAQAARDAVADLEKISRAIRPLRQGRYAITGATLVDGMGGPPVPDSIVLIEDGRIAIAGPLAAVTIPRGTPVFDARGKTILPGLWDMHAHVEQSEWIPASFAAGVTTMRDAGNEPEFIVPVREAIRAGRVTGPRLLLAGIVDSPPNALGNRVAQTPEEARALVRGYRGMGYEQIKIYQSLKPELVPVVAAEAHRLGMTVTGHVPTGMNAIEAVEAGMDQINHINFLLRVMRGRNWKPQQGVAPPPINLESKEAREAINFFRERGTVVDPTMARGELNFHSLQTPFAEYEPGMAKTPESLASILNHTGLPPDAARRAAPVMELAGKLTVALHRAGVPIVAGTDLVVPGHTTYRELELYVRAGMTPMEAIRSATIVPARVMRMDKELGTVEAGKVADLIILDRNPLENISNLRSVRFVVTRGRMYESAPFWRAADFQP